MHAAAVAAVAARSAKAQLQAHIGVLHIADGGAGSAAAAADTLGHQAGSAVAERLDSQLAQVGAHLAAIAAPSACTGCADTPTQGVVRIASTGIAADA